MRMKANALLIVGTLLIGAGLTAPSVPANADLFSSFRSKKADQQERPPSFADLSEKLLPAVVNISSTQKFDEDFDDRENIPNMPQFPPGSPFEDFFEDFMQDIPRGGGRGMPMLPPASLGSGFIVDADKGMIITNNHVVRGADEVMITFHDDETVEAEVIGRDEKTDIAVLKVDTDKDLVEVDLGDSDVMRVGDWVVAIGNPFGLGGTVTAGIVSARQRDINSGPYDDYIQTDASINRGNSGGPMFNLDGEVIGINTAIFSPSGGSVGIGFAIPSNLAGSVIDQIMKYGRTRRGWLGVKIQSVTDEIADSLGLGDASGALVAETTEGGPAEKAGLEAGDIILEFNGQEVDESRQLPRIVAETAIGENANVTVWRDNRRQQFNVEIGELEKAEEEGLIETAINDMEPQKRDKTKGTEIEETGLTVSAIRESDRTKYNLGRDITGLLITDVARNSDAARKGIVEGDVIVEINQKPLTSPAEMREAVDKALEKERSSVLLLLNQGGDIRFTGLKLKVAE